ncbi:MAG: calcium/sodium antiporter [Rhodobacteraceae bacterium]|nr:calcium/sodium antiporter [Paracoccaceae bacterium]
MDILFAVTGLVVLLLAGDALVRGAVNLGLRLGIPALLVSLTVVAFGTSAPELLVAIKAMLDNAPGIAVGNVVGSNIANVLLVLGVPALMAGIDSARCDSRKTYSFMLATTVIFIALCFSGPLYYWQGVILLALLAAMLAETVLTAQKHRKNGEKLPEEHAEVLEGADPSMPYWKVVMFLVLGLVGLSLGADLLVDGAVGIAREFGLSEAVIGLTLVAIGTSLPELATTVMAALRRHADVALGNVIGSNIFNILAIMGVTSFFGPVEIDQDFLSFDLWVMLAAALVIAPFVFGKYNITRLWGGILSALYLLYILMLLG